MESILLALLLISGFYFFILLLNSWWKKTVCAICAAVTITWAIFGTMYYLGLFSDKTTIALLLGHTSLGLFYLIEKKVPERITIFRLPFLLTLITSAYFFLVLPEKKVTVILVLALLWILFGTLFAYRTNLYFQKLSKKIIDCCKRW